MNREHWHKRIANMTNMVYAVNPYYFVRSFNLEFKDQQSDDFKGWIVYDGFGNREKCIDYPGDNISIEDFDILLKMDEL